MKVRRSIPGCSSKAFVPLKDAAKMPNNKVNAQARSAMINLVLETHPVLKMMKIEGRPIYPIYICNGSRKGAWHARLNIIMTLCM